MRDPARIDELLELLRVYWKRNPDLRLGQIVCNVMRETNKETCDPFYLEDGALTDFLRNETGEHNAEVDAQTTPRPEKG
jgi:uncharacterized protein YihD (DUF1040 family)